MYVPPLIDGACGTVPNAQQPALALMRRDVKAVSKMLPSLMKAVWNSETRNWRCWSDFRTMALHGMLLVLESYMLLFVAPLGLGLPGVMFMMWLAGCMALVMGLSYLLNGSEVVLSCKAGSDGWMMGQEMNDERWFFIGGMAQSSQSLSTIILPSLSKLFSRSITAIRMPTYGVLFDCLMMLMQRSFPFSTLASRILYSNLRRDLLDARIHRVVVLAHNIGSIPLSHALARLHADVPTDKMSKLEIYTFGSAAAEYLSPLGEHKKEQPLHSDFVAERKGPHLEHFAHGDDPFAHMGVLHSVKEHLVGRFCGGVFVIDCKDGHKNPARSAPMASIADYLMCLFPNQLGGGADHQSILDMTMTIDRDVAEKREFAAIANNPFATGIKKDSKRLSWTGLGATVGGANGVMDGIVGLEMARKGCKDCDGHRGREVSWLVRYVNIGQYMDSKDIANAIGVGMVQ